MWPKIGPVYTYGILYLLGFVCHFIVTGRLRRLLDLPRRVQVSASVLYMVAMTFGAKLLYDVHEGQFSWPALFIARHYLQGGLWGGLLFYLVVAAPVVLVLTRKRGRALDLVALSIPIPWIFAKTGCLLNGCCYGRPTSLPWAITFPEGGSAPAGVPLHPTQIYEIIVITVIGVVMWALHRRTRPGAMLWWFVLLYGVARAVTDFWRGDTDRYIYRGPLTLTQIVCLVGAAGAAAVLWRIRRMRQLEPSTATSTARQDIIGEVKSL